MLRAFDLDLCYHMAYPVISDRMLTPVSFLCRYFPLASIEEDP